MAKTYLEYQSLLGSDQTVETYWIDLEAKVVAATQVLDDGETLKCF